MRGCSSPDGGPLSEPTPTSGLAMIARTSSSRISRSTIEAEGSSATRSQRASQGSRPPAASARVRPTTAGSRWPVSSTPSGSVSAQEPLPTWPPSAVARRAARAAGSRRWARIASGPPAATAGGSRALSTVAPASYGYWSPWASTPASRAAASRSSSRPACPWAAGPDALQCDTWSRVPAVPAIVTASSRAASRFAPSSRMWVA